MNSRNLRYNPEPRHSDLAKVYYHGTPKESRVVRIATEGAWRMLQWLRGQGIRAYGKMYF